VADQQQWTEREFICDQGSEWRRYIRFWQDEAKTIPVDFTGYAIDMHIREGVADSGSGVQAHLSSRAGSDETQRIFFIGVNSAGEPVPEVEDETSGMVMLLLSADDTRQIVPTKVAKRGLVEATFVYDMEWTPPGADPQRKMAGDFVLSLEVTRR
jgi:hypothetical protein